eukprot:913492-Prymnesium_polylepis.1
MADMSKENVTSLFHMGSDGTPRKRERHARRMQRSGSKRSPLSGGAPGADSGGERFKGFVETLTADQLASLTLEQRQLLGSLSAQ